MIQKSYLKVKTIHTSAVGKVQLIQENQVMMVLKKYSKKLSEMRGLNSLVEYTITKDLNHPNIIDFKRVWQQDDGSSSELCLMMELMAPVHSIQQLLQPLDIQFMFSSIVKAMIYLHGLNIIHRDIKPSNILITREGVVKVSDFGIARVIDSRMSPSTCTKNYRPPELFFGKIDYDQSIDIWGLGCTLAELFIKSILFDGQRETEILSNIADQLGDLDETTMGDTTKLPLFFQISNINKGCRIHNILQQHDVPKDAQDLIIRMLSPNPSLRPSIQEVAQSRYVLESPRDSKSLQQISLDQINQTLAHYIK